MLKKVISGGGGNIIYIYYNLKNPDKIYNNTDIDFLFKLISFFKTSSYLESRVLNACLFDNKLQNVNNIDAEQYKTYYNNYSSEDNFEDFAKGVLQNVNKDLKVYISEHKIGNPDLYFKKVPYTQFIKKNTGFIITSETDLITQTKYYAINKLTNNKLNKKGSGDQMTLASDTEIQNRIKKGFKIEVFGSPFNARLLYFGSLFDTDEPFGRIGNAFEILEKLQNKIDLKWRNKVIISAEDIVKITVNPPSSYELQSKVFKYLYNVTQTRKIECYLDMQGSLYEQVIKNNKKDIEKYVIYLRKILNNTTYSVITYTKAYDLYNNTERIIPEWYCINFKNF